YRQYASGTPARECFPNCIPRCELLNDCLAGCLLGPFADWFKKRLGGYGVRGPGAGLGGFLFGEYLEGLMGLDLCKKFGLD
ncbi:MAG: hypothetical protein ACRDAM_04390, partial [Casimicrobium sp.]